MINYNALLTIAMLLIIFIGAQTVINVVLISKLFKKDKPFRLQNGNPRNPIVGRGIRD